MGTKEVANVAFTKALTVQAPLARKNVERLRRVHPEDSPKQLAKRVTNYYLTTVTSSGGAAGAGGIVPGYGLATAGLDFVAFTEASVFYTLTLAEIHGLHPEDIERRRLLVMTVLLGDSAISVLNKGADRAVPYWAKQIVNAIPMSAVNRANKILGPRFITKYGSKQGVLVLSKQVPFGISVVLGASANHVVGRMTTKAAKKVFGPAPKDWPNSEHASDADTSVEPEKAMTHQAAKRLVNAHFRSQGSESTAGPASWDRIYGVWIINEFDPTNADEQIMGGGPLVVTADGTVHETGSVLRGDIDDLMSNLGIGLAPLPDDVWEREGEGLALLADVDMEEAQELAAYAEEQHRQRQQRATEPEEG